MKTFEVLKLAKLINKHGAGVKAHRNTIEAGIEPESGFLILVVPEK